MALLYGTYYTTAAAAQPLYIFLWEGVWQPAAATAAALLLLLVLLYTHIIALSRNTAVYTYTEVHNN